MKVGAFELQEPLPELRDPHVFAMIRPWVDVGSVGTLTLNRLERYLGSKELGRLNRPGEFFDFTRYRPSMRLVDNERRVRIPNSIIRYATTENGPDYLFFHLREPHANSETYTDSILEVVEKVQREAVLPARSANVRRSAPHAATAGYRLAGLGAAVAAGAQPEAAREYLPGSHDDHEPGVRRHR